jgi:hypothetical protein
MDIRCSPNTLRILVRVIYSIFPLLLKYIDKVIESNSMETTKVNRLMVVHLVY